MVLGSLFFHRDSAARRLWRGEAEPEREFTGFPMRTALLVPPPIACTMWWYSARYKVVVLTPDGWGITHTSDGESCGWIALGGFAVLGLAIWWDGYVARQVRRRRAAGADADADADAGVRGTEVLGVEKVGKKKSARAAQAQKQPKAQSKKTK